MGVVPYHGESSSFLGIRLSIPSQALQRKASTGYAGPMASRVVSPRGEHYHCRPAARKVAHPTRNKRTDPKRRKGNPCHDRRNHKKRRNVTSRALIFSSPQGLIMWGQTFDTTHRATILGALWGCDGVHASRASVRKTPDYPYRHTS